MYTINGRAVQRPVGSLRVVYRPLAAAAPSPLITLCWSTRIAPTTRHGTALSHCFLHRYRLETCTSALVERGRHCRH